ncbi:uncharacterized protein METZ01_LOCUS115710, partial [marine metagenome]
VPDTFFIVITTVFLTLFLCSLTGYALARMRFPERRSNRQYSLWSDTRRPRPQFHAPERFGVVRFVAPEARGADHRGGP